MKQASSAETQFETQMLNVSPQAAAHANSFSMHTCLQVAASAVLVFSSVAAATKTPNANTRTIVFPGTDMIGSPSENSKFCEAVRKRLSAVSNAFLSCDLAICYAIALAFAAVTAQLFPLRAYLSTGNRGMNRLAVEQDSAAHQDAEHAHSKKYSSPNRHFHFSSRACGSFLKKNGFALTSYLHPTLETVGRLVL